MEKIASSGNQPAQGIWCICAKSAILRPALLSLAEKGQTWNDGLLLIQKKKK